METLEAANACELTAFPVHKRFANPSRHWTHGQDRNIARFVRQARGRAEEEAYHSRQAAATAKPNSQGCGEDAYTAADIEVLEGLEPVRRRPGMYIGGTDEKALHHLFAEVLDNAMDEAVAGHATRIEVELRGRRLPDRHRQRPRHPGRSASEVQEEVGARSHHDHAAFGRQVQLQGL